MRFDLRQLRYFVTVARYEHVGRAADELNISQSPLSRRIQQLEGQLGFDLFLRERQRIRLTTGGRRFLAEAERLLEHARTVESRAEALAAGRTGAVRIGFVEGAVYSGDLPRLTKAWRDAAPEAQFDYELARSSRQLERLRARELDLCLTYAPPRPEDELSSRLLTREPFLLAGAEGEAALADPNRADPKLLEGAPFIAPPAEGNPRFRAALLRAADAYGFAPHIRYQVAEEARLFAMAAAGAGLTLAQASMRGVKLPGLAFAELPGFELTVSVHLVWRRDEGCPLVSRLLELAVGPLDRATAPQGDRAT
ncbi:MAG: LysR substrate-binding domain-containing protein [Pseudomonadota bacterium]